MDNKKSNNITKEEALRWRKDNRNAFPSYRISDLICRRCFYGDEFEDIDNDGKNLSFEMSYICRAYNITSYGAANNRIKNVYAKYRKVHNWDCISNAVSQIVQQYPNGIPDEQPRFEELLQEYLEDESDYYNEDDGYEDDLNSSNRSTAGVSSAKIAKIVLPLIAVIVLIVIVVNLRHIILPVLGGIAVVALIIFVSKNMKGSPKTNSSASHSRTVNRTKRSQHGTRGAEKITFGKLAGAVIWAGIFIYAGSYYHKAGNPTYWMIIAIAIGIIGAGAILFKSNNK